MEAWCDPASVIGGVSMVGATLVGPGIATRTLAGPTFLGALEGRRSGGARQLADALDACGLDSILTDRITSVEWSKLVHANPSMAVTP